MKQAQDTVKTIDLVPSRNREDDTQMARKIEGFIKQLKFDENGLIPAIAQQYDTKDVLMLAWMSAQSLSLTFATGYATYWSRSRQSLWKKGETSGHLQKVHSCYYDCDKDSLLLVVDQKGPACHTGAHSCFFMQAFVMEK